MPTVQTMFPALGTVNTITLFDTAHKSAADEARDFVCDLDRRFSIFRPDSELSRFNALRGGEWMAVSEDTFVIFRESALCGKLTNGAFDVTAGPLCALWRDAIRSRRLPSAAEIQRAKRLVDYRDLRFDDAKKRVCLRKSGQSVDLGGIAKGYAADMVVELLECTGVQNAVINLGGTVGVLGRPQRVGIQDPYRPTGAALGSLTLQNEFAVTSGSYERGAVIDGKRRHHIIDPRTGLPAESGLLSVTLVGQCASELDALATAAFILGADAAMPILQSKGIEAVFVIETGEVFITPDLQSNFQLFQQKGA